jgi:hypothetical protein
LTYADAGEHTHLSDALLPSVGRGGLTYRERTNGRAVSGFFSLGPSILILFYSHKLRQSTPRKIPLPILFSNFLQILYHSSKFIPNHNLSLLLPGDTQPFVLTWHSNSPRFVFAIQGSLSNETEMILLPAKEA